MSLFDLGDADDGALRRDLLESRPLLSVDAFEKSTDCDETTVYVKVKSGGGFLARFRPPIMEKRYELDVFGTFVLRNLDGQKTVMELVKLFKERFGLSRRESELGVVAFLKILNHRHVINVIAGDHQELEI